MKRQLTILLHIFLLLALSACGAARQPSRLPDPEEVRALLVQLCDKERPPRVAEISEVSSLVRLNADS